MVKLATEEFIKKIQKVHEDRYDYSKVEHEHGAKQKCDLQIIALYAPNS